MKVTGDQALVKKINTSIALEAIQLHAPISRAQVASMTGLNKATVSNLVNELLEQQLVLEIGPGQSSGGRKPLMLLFNRHAGYTIGIELGIGSFTAILCDLSGQIVLEEANIPIRSNESEHVIDSLCDTITALRSQAPDAPYGTIGIGIGAPGMVDEEGNVLFAPNLGWRNVALKRAIEERFPGAIVTVDNEARAGAIGEWEYGAGEKAQHLVYISAGAGIGTGTIIGGELFKGAYGYSGEMGHMTIEANGRKCSCGNRGCWELYASEKAIAEAGKNVSYHSLEEIMQAAEQDEPIALHTLHQIGEYLGVGIANIINTFNPELVIIGNKLTQAERWIRKPLLRTVQQRTLQSHQHGLQIHFSSLQQRSTVLGAANQVIQSFVGRTKVSI